MIYDGPTAEGVARYVADNMIADIAKVSIADAKRTLSGLDQKLRFIDLKFHGSEGQDTLPPDGKFRLSVYVQANSDCGDFLIGLTVYSQDKTAIGSTFSDALLAPGSGESRIYELEATFPLAPGSYHCGISMTNPRSSGRELHDSLADVIPFEVSASSIIADHQTGQWSADWGYYRLDALKQTSRS